MWGKKGGVGVRETKALSITAIVTQTGRDSEDDGKVRERRRRPDDKEEENPLIIMISVLF